MVTCYRIAKSVAIHSLQPVTNFTQFALHPKTIGHTLESERNLSLSVYTASRKRNTMNIALTSIHVPVTPCFNGKRAFVRALVLGCAIAWAGTPAFAAQERDREGRNSQQQQPNHDVPPPRAERGPPPQQQQQRVDPRQNDAHANDEARRQAQQQDGGRRGGRLTPDERRELRRQINEAGVELYPNTPRR
jgi:hypothetical protein